jgi:uncharacterized membrane protein YkvA (DUF1232 family)
MTLWQWGLIALATLTLATTAVATTFALIKRKTRRIARHAPEVTVLCRGLIADPRVSPFHKLVLRVLVGYLQLPLDLIPDFIPIIGRLDDALVVGLAIRIALRSASPELIRQHWPGPETPPKYILKRAKGRARTIPALSVRAGSGRF